MNTRRIASATIGLVAVSLLLCLAISSSRADGVSGGAAARGVQLAQAEPGNVGPAAAPATGPSTPATRPAGRAGRGGAAGRGPQTIPPPGIDLSPADRQELEAGVAKLGKEIDALRRELADKPQLLALLPDVQIYHNAARYALTYREFFEARDVPSGKRVIEDGLARAKQLRDGRPEWVNASGPRGYVSDIDGSVQPYVLVVPMEYKRPQGENGPNADKGDKRYQLALWCHGRDERLSELRFIYGRQGQAPAATPDRFVIWLYGRYCCANKFAGEIDCFEAMNDLKKRVPIDENRILMMGFSMGGASAWQFATHYPDVWAAASPGAGFSESEEFLRMPQSGELERTPWYQKALFHWYNCTDYAANLFNLPVIAYAGEIDPQKQASDAMIRAMEPEGLKLERIIGPKTAHAYEKGARAELDKRLDEILARGRNPVPPKVRFTTWTLRYNRVFWLTVDGLGKHWARARADGEVSPDGVKLTTQNVTALTVSLPATRSPLGAGGAAPTVTIDGQKLGGPAATAHDAWTVHLVKSDAGWQTAAKAIANDADDSLVLRKRHGLQGPIDDAFMEPFLIVRPTGKAMNEQVGAWTKAECDHAIDHWRKQFRGQARVKDDRDVKLADIVGHNLVLFGDPSSNKVLGQIIGKLPVRWDAQEVAVGSNRFPADRHAPVLIYPNPLYPRRYVVVNSGFTFREFDYTNNARQIPRLPDWAVIDTSVPATPRAPGGVAAAGFFGERWEVRPDGPDGR